MDAKPHFIQIIDVTKYSFEIVDYGNQKWSTTTTAAVKRDTQKMHLANGHFSKKTAPLLTGKYQINQQFVIENVYIVFIETCDNRLVNALT